MNSYCADSMNWACLFLHRMQLESYTMCFSVTAQISLSPHFSVSPKEIQWGGLLRGQSYLPNAISLTIMAGLSSQPLVHGPLTCLSFSEVGEHLLYLILSSFIRFSMVQIRAPSYPVSFGCVLGAYSKISTQ